MSVMFGSARIGENSSASGNKAGDASGSEVSTQAYYTHSKGWYGFAPKSADVAKKLAQAMQDACDNDHIGYDQADRETLLTQYKKYGSIKAITTDCECDCSSLVRVCIYQATGTLLSNFVTAEEPTVLANSGLFESKKSITAASQTSLGMILVTKTSGHTGIIVSGVSASGSSSSGSTSGSSGTKYTSTLTVDGQIGKNTTKRLQTVMGTTVDGTIDGQDSRQKKYWTAVLSTVCKWSGGSSEVVKALQKYVNNKGYSCGTVDGELGQKTAKALQKFLIAKGYSCGSSGADGIIGTNSAKALQKWLNDQK